MFSRFCPPEVSSARRREIALQLEKMLWEPPFLSDHEYLETLPEFARHLNVSVRTIQLAVQEQFGVGFVEFRRLIQLTQFRKALLKSNRNAKLTTLALDYNLNHLGRTARLYRDLFGKYPSDEFRKS